MTLGQTPRASVVDRFFAAVDGLPGPPEVLFSLGGVLIAVLAHLVVWGAGEVALGTLYPDLWVAPLAAGYFLAVIAFMKRTANSAFADFRPALGDQASEEVEHRRLTSLTNRAALFSGVAMVFVTFGAYFALVQPTLVPRPPIVDLLVAFLWIPTSIVLGLTIAHVLSQLRAVRHLSEIAQRIDVLNPGPVDALSRVTLAGSVGLLIFVPVATLGEPSTASGYLGLDAAVIAFAVLAFLLPLQVMHRRLGEQKAELLAASSARVRKVLDQLHKAIDGGDMAAADGINKMVTSALAERDLLTRLSTWPWTTTTIRGFGSALLLPVVIFVITRGIDRLI